MAETVTVPTDPPIDLIFDGLADAEIDSPLDALYVRTDWPPLDCGDGEC